MKICFVTKERLTDFWERTGGVDADVVFFPLFDNPVVSYERELKGETAYFEDVAMLSKAGKNVVVCGYVTSTRSLVRSSAVVAENGRILGVSDAITSVDGARNCGAFLKVYETGVGRIGVAVAEDAYFPEILRTLAVCGSDAVLCPFSGATGGAENVVLRAAAFSYGTPVCMCAQGYAFVAGADGEAAFSSPHSPVFFNVEKNGEFHLVEWRQRGFKKPPPATY
ncbi:MAG: nitrilase-related carbon-nitrogen hydrolase [Candidatus Borkfalkiaceae bacterium]|nr:hypothetical protein [Clostridia bacterium]MDY6224193.1 nitrilase-related carbon-nitrogen hydrolase [Christensenellaceae bacterium]